MLNNHNHSILTTVTDCCSYCFCCLLFNYCINQLLLQLFKFQRLSFNRTATVVSNIHIYLYNMLVYLAFHFNNLKCFGCCKYLIVILNITNTKLILPSIWTNTLNDLYVLRSFFYIYILFLVTNAMYVYKLVYYTFNLLIFIIINILK
jgi:hypothetical protein